MTRLFYRPKRLQKKTAVPGGFDRIQRCAALFLCICMMLTMIPTMAFAIDGFTVRFANYDLSDLEHTGPFEKVAEGAKLYTADELSGVTGFSPKDGCTWYLYYEGGGDAEAFGPEAISDPPEREGYTFRDWAVQGAADDTLYTVTGNTTFVARYVSDGQYVVNLYYQFDNESHTVAAETSTVPYGWESQISIQLPTLDSLKGLSPGIQGSKTLDDMLSDGTFSGKLDDTFLGACRDAGFIAWDQEANDYQKDENGNIQINIPVTYELTGEVTFQVEYYLQNAEDNQYTLVSADTETAKVTGTTHVSLNEMKLVHSYEGFALTAASMEDADSYNVSTDDSSIIKLYYDRDIHYVYYQMNGGNVREPVELRYGQSFPEDLTADPTRQGYTFDSWTWLNEDGTQTVKPAAMPNHDLTLSANWVGANTTVTLVYWLENANDDDYTVAGQQTISVRSGQTVGYEHPDHDGEADVSINRYVDLDDPDYSAQNGVGGVIGDIDYFTFASADSSTAVASGQEGELKTAAGDGSTVINIGYTRNEYTLVFHLGRINSLGWPQISYRTDSTAENDPTDWQSSHSWIPVTDSSVIMNDQEFSISNHSQDCYQITAKYGAYISDKWPDTSQTTAGMYKLFTWATHAASDYYKTHSNKNIIGTYATMSQELIIRPKDPSIAHHLVAYWSTSDAELTHHYMFEAVKGTEGEAVPFSQYEDYGFVSGDESKVQGLSFYEYSSTTVRTTAPATQQNAPEFSNLTYRYGCYYRDEVYFFYTYNNYTLTYHENNANLTPGQEQDARTESVTFHYVDGKPVKDLINQPGWNADYEPSQAYVSSYGNKYTFLGWYTSNLTEDATDNERFRVKWETFAPSSNVNVYAAWEAPTFTLTLIVPDGELYQDSLDQFAEKGYAVTSSTGGDGVTTYVVSDIPGGIKSSEIIARRHGAQSDYGLTFDYWSYEVNGKEQHYLFDESQYITSDLTLTARWKTEYTGQYAVRCLTKENPNNNLGSVTLDGTTYYRLREDKIVTNVAVGSSVTVEAAAINGYLSSEGQTTQTVEAPEAGQNRTYFDFIYTQISGSITYYVHYVQNTGVDYSRGSPPDDVVRLADDKTVTVTDASLRESTTVSEAAKVVGGYSPRDGWNVSFTLSAAADQNHLYIYYVSNTHSIPFTVKYFFQQADGTYDTKNPFRLSGVEALGKVLYSADLAENYDRYLDDTQTLDDLRVGHVLDTAITDSYLILTQSGENTLLLYMKNGSYTLTYNLNDGGDTAFPASWDNADEFLTRVNGARVQTVTYPNPADVPTTTPSRLSYVFTGWKDGDGKTYTMAQLGTAPWYTGHGLYEDVTLYAKWEKQLTVTFNLRGGTWTDTSGQFHLTGEGYYAYAAAGAAVPQPSDPTFTASDGTAYSFIGWTTADPSDSAFIGQNGRVNLAEFEKYRFDFGAGITTDTILYAVWDPDVTTFAIVKTDTDTKNPTYLAGASFTLERLKAEVTVDPDSGYTYELILENGDYVADPSFPARAITTDQAGMGAFSYLPAGYYRLTETRAPAGYTGLDEPVILFAPYGEGPPRIDSPAGNGAVTGTSEDATLTIRVRNVSQYDVTITAPDFLTLTYTPPDLIWNPETLEYEGMAGAEGGWTVAAPEGQDAVVTVTNKSPGASVQVEVSLRYDKDHQLLLPLSTLTAEDDSSFIYEKEDGVLAGVLTAAASARFRLTMEGTLLPDVILPTETTQVGTITVRVTKPSG